MALAYEMEQEDVDYIQLGTALGIFQQKHEENGALIEEKQGKHLRGDGKADENMTVRDEISDRVRELASQYRTEFPGMSTLLTMIMPEEEIKMYQSKDLSGLVYAIMKNDLILPVCAKEGEKGHASNYVHSVKPNGVWVPMSELPEDVKKMIGSYTNFSHGLCNECRDAFMAEVRARRSKP